MINQYEVHTIVHDCLPDLTQKCYPTRLSLVVYATVNEFSDYTYHAIESNDFELAKRCFKVAEKLLAEGDKTVRKVIENSFIETISSVIISSLDKMFMMKAIMPKPLYNMAIRHTLNKK